MPAKWAVLSDIHGNIEALEAVLADAAACGADQQQAELIERLEHGV